MLKPPAEHTSYGADVAATYPWSEGPPTPGARVTPAFEEALTSLHSLIEQDAYAAASDDASRQRLQRRVQKLASAAKMSLAEQSLLRHYDRLVDTINNGARPRPTTRSLMIDTGDELRGP